MNKWLSRIIRVIRQMDEQLFLWVCFLFGLFFLRHQIGWVLYRIQACFEFLKTAFLNLVVIYLIWSICLFFLTKAGIKIRTYDFTIPVKLPSRRSLGAILGAILDFLILILRWIISKFK